MALLMLHGPDGNWYHRLPRHLDGVHWMAKLEWFADDQPMQLRPGENPNHAHQWWVADHEPGVVVGRWTSPATTVGYRLKDSTFESARLPLELSAEAWRGLGDDVPEQSLYRAVTEPGEQREVRFPADRWVRADGEPAPLDGRSWVASLPHDLTQHEELLHLFPGYMPGCREAAKKFLERQPNVRYVFDKDGRLEVTLSIPYERPRTVFRRNILRDGREGKTGRQVPERYQATLNLAVPYRIDAPSRAQAVAQWDAIFAELRAVVAQAGNVRACDHCSGTGLVEVPDAS